MLNATALRIEMQTQIRSIVGILSPCEIPSCGVLWKFWGRWHRSSSRCLSLSLLRSSWRNRYRARASRIADVNYYARRSANCLIAWRAFDSDTILARRNIYIKSVPDINPRQKLKNKFTIPPDINCRDLRGRIASSCSCASHRKLLRGGGKTSAISSSTLYAFGWCYESKI